MRGQVLSDEIRAKVIAEIVGGAGVSDISRRMQLPKQTVSDIKNAIAPEILGQVRTEKQQEMESMIVGYLGANFKALTAICEVSSDANYLKSQSASEIASLHDGLATRAFRLLEAESSEAADTQ